MTDQTMQGPHQGQSVQTAGVVLEQAAAAMILAHGRGAGAHDILDLARFLDHPQFSYLAPQAANNTWYPYSFLAPIEGNEPGLSSSLQVLNDLVAKVEAAGGSVVKPTFPFPGGRRFHFADPSGNEFGVWSDLGV